MTDSWNELRAMARFPLAESMLECKIYDYHVEFQEIFRDELPRNSPVKGCIKWDECVNLEEQPTHYCDKSGLGLFVELMTLLWTEVAPLCPNWIGR